MLWFLEEQTLNASFRDLLQYFTAEEREINRYIDAMKD